ncbi:MAG: hypothetical protein J6O55_07560 [Lachnospiraceae bacterium]|nr:hypothetical protein [Lachnospiraceae bacterium]
MKKKIVALLVCAAVSVLSVVPVFAGPAEDIASAVATQAQQLTDMASYQQALEAFRQAQIAQGVAETEQGKAAFAAYQAQLAAFYQNELARGEVERTAGQAAAAVGAANLANFYQTQLLAGAAQSQAGLDAYNAYQAAFSARENGVLAQVAANQAERSELQKVVDKYLAGF